MGGASAALPATTDSMSQALAALNNIKISTPVGKHVTDSIMIHHLCYLDVAWSYPIYLDVSF